MELTRPFTCADCGAAGTQSLRGRNRLRCDRCREAARSYESRQDHFPEVDCAGCYQPFRAHHLTQRWCSVACGNRHKAGAGPRGGLSPEARERQRLYWQEKNRRRRAAKRGGASEPYTLAGIAGRDRRRCGLCGRLVPMDKKVPHPQAPTIDHIVPVSEGGDDTRANVQLAHFRCNNVKGARGCQQLALIG